MSQNLIILILHVLDFENRKHTKFNLIGPLISELLFTRVPSSSLCVASGTIVVDNVGIFGSFLWVLPFPNIHSTNILHFKMLSSSN